MNFEFNHVGSKLYLENHENYIEAEFNYGDDLILTVEGVLELNTHYSNYHDINGKEEHVDVSFSLDICNVFDGDNVVIDIDKLSDKDRLEVIDLIISKI